MSNRDRQPISRKWHLGYFNKKKLNPYKSVNKKEFAVKTINQVQIEQNNVIPDLIEHCKEMDDYLGISQTKETIDWWGDIHEYDLYISMIRDGYKFMP